MDKAIPPVLFNIGGKYYICPGWHEVSCEITYSEVMERWNQLFPRQEFKPLNTISKEVVSSKGDKKYLVTFDRFGWNCTCVGFGFRRNCSHITQVK